MKNNAVSSNIISDTSPIIFLDGILGALHECLPVQFLGLPTLCNQAQTNRPNKPLAICVQRNWQILGEIGTIGGGYESPLPNCTEAMRGLRKHL